MADFLVKIQCDKFSDSCAYLNVKQFWQWSRAGLFVYVIYMLNIGFEIMLAHFFLATIYNLDIFLVWMR